MITYNDDETDKRLESQSSLGKGDIPIAGVIGGLLGFQLGVSAIFLASVSLLQF